MILPIVVNSVEGDCSRSGMLSGRREGPSKAAEQISFDRRVSSRPGAYRGDRLHAQHKRIRGEVPRVRESIFLPQLTEQILGRSHARMI